MIAHVVLFRPKPQLTADERSAFVATLEHALNNIAVIKRSRVGRRITIGRQYDLQNADDYPFAAILEFENEIDLRAYLDHSAHRAPVLSNRRISVGGRLRPAGTHRRH